MNQMMMRPTPHPVSADHSRQGNACVIQQTLARGWSKGMRPPSAQVVLSQAGWPTKNAGPLPIERGCRTNSRLPARRKVERMFGTTLSSERNVAPSRTILSASTSPIDWKNGILLQIVVETEQFTADKDSVPIGALGQPGKIRHAQYLPQPRPYHERVGPCRAVAPAKPHSSFLN